MKINEEIKNFLKENPGAKPIRIKIDHNLKKQVEGWARFNTMVSSELDKIKNIQNIEFNKLPPVILHNYSSGMKIIDGWHRLYVAIEKNIPTIMAYVKSFKNSTFKDIIKNSFEFKLLNF